MITSESIKEQYSPITPTTSYPFGIAYFVEEDIHVVHTSGNVDTELTLNATPGGFTVSPVNGTPEYGATITTSESYTDGDIITIYRDVPITNESEFVRGGDIPPEVINEVNDRGTAVDQQLNEEISLSLRAPIGDPAGLNYTIGNVEERKNNVMSFDDDGNVTSVDLVDSGTVAVDPATGLMLVNNIISGKVDDSTIGFNGSGAFEVKSITGNEITDNTISGSKLIDDAITTVKIINDAVTTDKIVDDAITSDKIATDAVISAGIQDGAVTKRKLADLADYTVLGNTSGSAGRPEAVVILDEDDMSSDSLSALVTQQSVKAYVGTVATAAQNYAMQYSGSVILNTGPVSSGTFESKDISSIVGSNRAFLHMYVLKTGTAGNDQRISFKTTSAIALDISEERGVSQVKLDSSKGGYVNLTTHTDGTFWWRIDNSDVINVTLIAYQVLQ